jgi:hypothetical protein
MYCKKYILLTLLLFYGSIIFAQQEDTGASLQEDTSIILRSYRINPVTWHADSAVFDTSMQEFFIYNPIYKSSFSNSFLGNNGQAYQSNDFMKRHSGPEI